MQTDAQLLEQLHAELDERRVRISKITLAIAFLALIALWGWSQGVVP